MNFFSTRWFSEQEIEENSIIQQYGMNSIVGEVNEAQYTLPQSSSFLDTNHTTKIGYKNDPSYDDLIEMKPSKILKTTYILPNSSPLPSSSNPHFHHHQPSSRILSFENAVPNAIDHKYSPTYLNSISSPKVKARVPPYNILESSTSGILKKWTKKAQPLARRQSNAQNRIIAERKRRDDLTQRFVALSAQIPGLKKMDKASVLGDALNHIKYLQETVKEFEEEKKERRFESMVLVKKSKLILDDNNQSASSTSSEDGSSGLNLPEIEVRFSDNDVLIKILCEKQNDHIVKIMVEIKKLCFSIIHISAWPFGPTLDITIIAQKKGDFDMTLMDVVKNLRFAFSKFM